MDPTPADNLIDFGAEDTGRATLTRFVPKSDGSEETLTVDIDLVFDLGDVGDVGDVSGIVGAFPQAEEALGRAADKRGSTTVTWKPAASDVRITLLGQDDEPCLDDAPAKVRQLTLRTTERASAIVARLRVFDVRPRVCGDVLERFGKRLDCSSAPAQGSFDFGSQCPEVGDVVSGVANGEPVYGVVTRELDDGSYAVDDFGTVYQVHEHDIAAVIKVRADGYKNLKSMMLAFKSGCKKQSEQPTWHRLVVTFARLLGEGGIDREPDGTYVVTRGVIASALEGELPPEAGEATG